MGTSDRERLREFILSTFLPGEDPSTLADDTPLYSTGIITSLGMLELVAFIEEALSVRLDEDDLEPDALDSIEMIVEKLQRHRLHATK